MILIIIINPSHIAMYRYVYSVPYFLDYFPRTLSTAADCRIYSRADTIDFSNARVCVLNIVIELFYTNLAYSAISE